MLAVGSKRRQKRLASPTGSCSLVLAETANKRSRHLAERRARVSHPLNLG